MAPSAVTAEASPTATDPTVPAWDLDITLVEQVDPAKIVVMTDDNCGNTCEKSTCISAV
ncbi:FxLD family lanthipeptide [Actinacidiphila sp. DG2A-62]|uniref:FxLD family lanthipeptide n=1 Tax=Actinacidiphila sp. DG2A-62 TaxID=3108821 RepID=UPI002DB6F78D|nr:FxLD family lanthipeptide [Actinacidiphila sp. DG2A-62]MEC3997218.1 FxLD family lanthipeptide [Actinacidiphila sp. DG2A-62]